MIPGVVVQVGAGLRISELIALRKCDVKRRAKKSTWLHIVNDKRANAKRKARAKKNERGYEKWVICQDTEALIHSIAGKTKSQGDLLFPPSGWRVNHLRAAIQAGAKALGWPGSLKRDGSHCLRHGGVRRFKKDVRQCEC